MSIPHLTTYLNDHLAASVMAIDMIAFAAARSEGTPLGSFLTQLHSEIEEDQTVVRNLLERLDVSENPVKKATAWVAEKVSRLKLEASDNSDPLARLQALETLQIGILGKRALWGALEVVVGDVRGLAGLDFPSLRQRAQDQHDRVEEWRLKAAREALSPIAGAQP